MAHLLGIFSTGKYPKTKKFVSRTKAAPRNALICSSMAQFLHTPNISDFLRNSYRTEVLTISLKETQKCFYKYNFEKYITLAQNIHLRERIFCVRGPKRAKMSSHSRLKSSKMTTFSTFFASKLPISGGKLFFSVKLHNT